MSELYRIDRILEIFFRSLKGEKLSVKQLALQYNCSAKSISRDITTLKNFLADQRNLVGNAQLEYNYKDHTYTLYMSGFLTSEELFAVLKIVIGTRGLNTKELLTIVEKLKSFSGNRDRKKVDELIRKELYHYQEIKHDCNSVIKNIWELTTCIYNQNEISITYYKMSREEVTRRLCPLAIIFSEYYYYLIAFDANQEKCISKYYRADRITHITVHRKHFVKSQKHNFNEGELRKKIQFMFPGQSMHIKFEFTGPSIQAVLDRIPTAKVVGQKENTYTVEADVYGDGIKMYLLSQGHWVKVLQPETLKKQLKDEIAKMYYEYGGTNENK